MTRFSARAIVLAGLMAAAPAAALAEAFPAAIDLGTLDGTNGIILDGADNAGGYSGNSVSAAGDVNGDGFADIVIGAPFESHNGIRPGMAYVLFGGDQGFPAQSSLATLDGTNGFAIAGTADTDRAGYTVSGAGDVNGDGLDDIIVEATYAEASSMTPDTGRRYVVFGASQAFPAVFNLSALDGTNGFALNGINSLDVAWAGANVSGAGDVNGDGFGDIVIGAHWASPYPSDPFFPEPGPYDLAGQSYLVFGAAGGFPAAIDLAALDGTNGMIVNGYGYGAESGTSVSGAGDINADGFDDFIIGAPRASNGITPATGRAYVIYGTNQPFPAVLELSAFDGTRGVVFNGGEIGDGAGYAVSDAGDVNGDGIDDIIIGAPGAGSDFNVISSRSYVVFGNNQGFPAQVELSSLDGSNGFVLMASANAWSGGSVSGAGDVNGDGLDDVVIGDFFADIDGKTDAGQSHVVFGSNRGFPPSLELSALDGRNGFALNGIGAHNRAGYSVSDAGDLNADGIDDVIIGAPTVMSAGNFPIGQSYVIFGRSLPTVAVSGACPGTLTITTSGATPNGAVQLLHSDTEGTFVVPLGSCAGMVLDLANPLPFGQSAADGTGTAVETVMAPASACGRFLQAVDETTCTPSNVVQLP